MERDVNKLEEDIRKILKNSALDTVVELADLNESTSNQLRKGLGCDYNIKEIVKIGIKQRNYTLHISK